MNRRTHNIHERFLRHIWSKQYLTADLQTADGKTLKVFDVGQLNSDGGPDFCNAKIKIDDVVKMIDTSTVPLVVNFWASWCKPCVHEIPWFEKNIESLNHQKAFICKEYNN